MKWVNRLYIFFLGIILSITTGFGIATFYPEPVRPEHPFDRPVMESPKSCYETPSSQASEECREVFAEQEKERVKNQEKIREYESKLREFNNRNAGYSRTAIFFGVAIGALFAIFGLSLIKISKLIANGFLLGGLLTAILTRVLISLASFGASVTGTEGGSVVGYAQFVVLVLLSGAVIFVGLFTLREESSSSTFTRAKKPS